ncbi:MAG: 30S ribosomal protein S9 [Nanoarchaeota archaeon]|nr:30S ribosomal protein S9 [Nanoarchaeota archaeon]MBU4300345.1 30S ribosomal protein S9 [Nanoarchaeota archaeon]MBU4452134.1 30S ribosomal protein S9 [Nanoarchaeota archaeon]MCG2724266.1 30S ribosomal protein S9 [archaeon]
MKTVNTVGKRKTAIARATLRDGKGKVTINGAPLKFYAPEIARLKIEEAIILSAPLSQKIDIAVEVVGGGVFGQADAARQAIARGLVQFSESAELKQKYLAYDRNLLIYDSRRTEVRKPSRSSQGARRTRQLSKR